MALYREGLGYWSGGTREEADWDPSPFKADDFTDNELAEFELDVGEQVVRLTFDGPRAHAEVIRTQRKRGQRKKIDRSGS